MLNGYAIELMDGENSFIWSDWIEAILEHLGDAIKDFINPNPNEKQIDPKGITISIIGP